MGCIVILLILILASVLAGPFGFLIALALILAWAVITGSLKLLGTILLLPFRLVQRLLRD
jgi:hypothetical protein